MTAIRRAQWPTAATLGAIALIGLLLQPVSVVRVTTSDGERVACRHVANGDTVTLAFTHSMYGGEVRETWRVDGGQLLRVGIETDNAAAAEYYATDGRVERTDTGFEVIAPPLEIDELPFRIDRIGDHRLRFGSEELSLIDRVGGSAGAKLDVTRVPLLQRMIDGEAGCGG